MKESLHMFEGANIGDLFETTDGCKAVYLGFDCWKNHHLLYIENDGKRTYHDDGHSTNGVISEDITGPYREEPDPEALHTLRGWEIAHVIDTLNKCRRYLLAVERRGKRDENRINKLNRMVDSCKKILKI